MSGRTEEPARRGWEDHDQLSHREREILALCAEGLSNREIGERLFVGVETVKTHLRNVFARLGLRNRAQAAAYYLGSPAGDAVPDAPPDAPPLAAQLGLDAAAIEGRLALLGLSAAARDRLAPLGDAVDARSGAFTTRLYERLREHEETARYLDDDVVVERLRTEQRRYLRDLFTAPFDARHVDRMLRVGATHHRIGLAPQWYLATYAPIFDEHLDLVFAGAADDADAIETAIVLLSSALFDAGLVLDAYEVSLADEIASGVARRLDDGTAAVTGSGATGPGAADATVPQQRPLTRVHLTRDEAAQRRRFVGLDTATIAEVRGLATVVRGTIPTVLEAFYALLAATPSLADLVPAGAAGRLMDQVASYWAELVDSEFDRAHAATRMRVGVIHERIGLSPQLYLAGLARQAAGVLRALPGQVPDVPAATRALVRALVFDVTFVIDAYIEARGEALLHAGGYAEQLVAGLVSGVVVVDARDRIDHANQALLDLVGVRAGVLRRMPVARALPFADVTDLLQAARRAASGRATSIGTCRGRPVRLTAVALRLGAQPTGGPVAVIVDDLSEVMRAGDRVAEGDHTLDRVLAVVEAIVWEIDAEHSTVLAISRSVARLTGRDDVDVLGRPFTTLLPAEERTAFRAACAATAQGAQRLRHRLWTGGAQAVEVDSVLVRIVDTDGSPRVCGVSRTERAST